MSEDGLVRQVQDAFWLMAENLMLHHTTPWELDEALEGFGYGLGPCLAQDHLGLARVLARRTDRTGPLLTRMVAEGRLGKIGGVGFYRYPGGGGAVIDPLIEDLFREEAWFGKIERRDIGPNEILSVMNGVLVELCKTAPAGSDWGAVLGKAVQFPADKMGELGS